MISPSPRTRYGRTLGVVLLLAAYLLCLHDLTLRDQSSFPFDTRKANMIPFMSILRELGHPVHSALHKAYYLVGNLCLMAPLVVLLLLLKPDLKKAYLVFLSFLLSVTIEVVQYTSVAGRVGDVDDVLLNTTGAFLACVILERGRLKWIRNHAAPAATPRPPRAGSPGTSA